MMATLRMIWLAGLVVFLAGVVQAPAFQLGSRPAKQWIERLERPERVANLKTGEVVSRLKLFNLPTWNRKDLSLASGVSMTTVTLRPDG